MGVMAVTGIRVPNARFVGNINDNTPWLYKLS